MLPLLYSQNFRYHKNWNAPYVMIKLQMPEVLTAKSLEQRSAEAYSHTVRIVQGQGQTKQLKVEYNVQAADEEHFDRQRLSARKMSKSTSSCSTLGGTQGAIGRWSVQCLLQNCNFELQDQSFWTSPCAKLDVTSM